jgi:anti-sigma factor RsiW
MNCEQSKERLTGWLSNQLADSDRMAINKHLSECPDCQVEFEADRQLWQLMGKVVTPQPTEQLREGFYAMLDDYQKERSKEKPQSVARIYSKITTALDTSIGPSGSL